MGGELSWSLVLNYRDYVPVPSVADGFYWVFYIASYVALMLLLRGRLRFRGSQWLDGAIAASAVAAFAAAIAFEPIVEATVGDPLAVAVNLSYPLADLLLLSLVVASFALSGWRPDRGWALIGLGMGLMAVGDGIYLFQSAQGTYVEGTLLDAMWPAAALLAHGPARRAADRGLAGHSDPLHRGARGDRAARVRPLRQGPRRGARARHDHRGPRDGPDGAHVRGEPGDAAPQ
jgi:hypothetical protein